MDRIVRNQEGPAWFTPYANIRPDSYAILASLLLRPPPEELLDILGNLAWDQAVQPKLHRALQALRQAGLDTTQAVVADEFGRLFTGLGCGEMEPCACWYRERKIQARPLALLRADLYLLGIVRQTGCRVSEDHAGALCEVMALLSDPAGGIPCAVQAGFFAQHIRPWMPEFFRDLQSANNAAFYRAVGLFGRQFLESDSDYLNHGVHAGRPANKGAAENENGNLQQPEGVSEACGGFVRPCVFHGRGRVR